VKIFSGNLLPFFGSCSKGIYNECLELCLRVCLRSKCKKTQDTYLDRGENGRIVAHPVSYPNVFKTDSGSDTDS
jgi:hypothetical protein